ncbi:MAG: hypothetical protein M3P49_02950 [Actinomycetota bacterium]|nr:hypothetical protein [Actinomycetota bacterium]
MSRYPGVDALIEAGGRRSTRQDFADRITTKSTQVQDAQEALADNGIVPNTQLAPSPPTGIFIKARNRGMDIAWDAPPAADHVAVTEVMLVRVGDNTTTIHKFEPKLLAGSINGLNPVDYDVTLQHRNKFGAVSGFTAPAIRITPTPTIAEQISADIQIAATQITGQLGQAQVPTITDPSKLAEEVVKGIAAVANRNVLPLPESRFDSYPLGDWAAVGPKQHAYGAATTEAQITADGAGRRWLRQNVGAVSGATSTAVGSGWMHPFGIGRYDVVAGDWGIFSVRTLNPTGTDVNVRVCANFYDANKNSVGNALGPIVTTPASSGARIFFKTQAPTGTAHVRVFTEITTQNVGLNFNDFQLEKVASTATTPSAFATPAMFTGAIGANIIGALDLLAVRAILGNATIESAKVVSIAAEKFVGGIISGQEFVLATGGRFRTSNNGTRIDDGGITLAHGADFNIAATTIDKKISSLADRAAVAFYHDTTTGFRGVVARSDGGNTDTTRGAISLHATYAGVLDAASTARIELLSTSANGEIDMYGNTDVFGRLVVAENMRAAGLRANVQTSTTSIAAGGTLIITHGRGDTPYMVPQYEYFDGTWWRPLINGVNSWTMFIGTTEVRITNGATAARSVRGQVWA